MEKSLVKWVPEVENTLVKIPVVFWEVIDLDLQGQI